MQVHPVNYKILSFLDLNKIIFCNSSCLRRVISHPVVSGVRNLDLEMHNSRARVKA